MTADGDTAFTPVPANTYGASANGYVVAADVMTGDSELMLWHVSGAVDPPSLTADGEIGVSAYAVPASIPQPGTSKVLDSLDSRLTQAVAAADPDAGGALALWTQHTIAGSGGRTAVRWYEIVPGAVTPLRQEGTISDPNLYVFNGAISPAANGSSAVVNYDVGNSVLSAQIRAQSRTSASALGSMGGEYTLGSSAAADQDFTCTPVCRWGDYGGASPDPINTSIVWGSNQANGVYGGGGNPHWITRNFAIDPAANVDNTAPTTAVPTRALFAPQTLGTTAQLRVSWPAASDPSGIASYELQRKKGTGSWVNVTLPAPTATSVDVDVVPGTNYAFRLRATDGAANTGPWAMTSGSKLALLQETATSITYTGTFKRVALSGSSGGYVRKASVAGRVAKLTFQGSSVAFVTTRAPSRGIVQVRLDGGSWDSLDLYAATTQTKRIVWAAGFGAGAHTLEVRVTGTKNPSATASRVDIDAFLVLP
jgi:hypothetical protein